MSIDRAIQNPDTKTVRLLDVAEVSHYVHFVLKKFAVLFYCWYSLYTFFLLNLLSFSMVTVTRLFCLVESRSQYAAANAGVLSVNLTTYIERENIRYILMYTMTMIKTYVRNSLG